MKKPLKVLALLTVMLVSFALLSALQSALGFGDFDSDSDYGGSDSSWDSGSSRDHDYSRSSGNSGGGSVGEAFLIIFSMLFLIAAVCVPIGYLKARKEHKRAVKNRPSGAGLDKTAASKEEGLRDLLQRDPSFREEDLFDHARRLFTQMQDAWEAGDISSVRYGFEQDTWERFNTQLQMKNARGETTHVRDIAFGDMRIVGCSSAQDKDLITLRFEAVYNVWVTNKKGRNIQGSPSTRHRMEYEWILTRPKGVVSAPVGADRARCPGCGAEIDSSVFAECPFCHTQLSREGTSWAIRDIRALSQRTVAR